MKEELTFCPLGGSGEIGMNMNLFAFCKPDDQKWIIVDVGVTFADDTVPGVDLIYPDPGFIEDKKEDLLGIILTHAHEDHIGAITHIWPKLKCKIFATPFTAVLVNEKFREKKIDIVVSLYHDQGLIPFKYLGIGNGVNITIGLPFVRTSPDHGTAFDIAGKGIANPESFFRAVKYAQEMIVGDI